jgi:hypothetical protein
MVASVGRFLGETRDSRQGSARQLEGEAENGKNGEGIKDRLGRVEMEEGVGWSGGACARVRVGGTGNWQQRESGGRGRWCGSRAGELKGKATLAGRPRPQCRAAVLNSF